MRIIWQQGTAQDFGSYCISVKSLLEQAQVLFVLFDSLRPSQQFFSYVGTGLPGLTQY